MEGTSTATVDRLVRLDAPEKPRRRLPFSTWHLFLAPVAVIMLVPLIWMVILSLETSSEAQSFPPVVLPTGCTSTTTLRRGTRSRLAISS